jgi:signal peptidase I
MKSIIYTFSISLILGLFLKTCVAEPFTVPTNSMMPTIPQGAKIGLLKLPFTPKKRDVIGFKRNGENFIKRIVGIPSDKVLKINGQYQIFQNKLFANTAELGLFNIPKKGETIVLNPSNFDFYQPLIAQEDNNVGRIFDKIFINTAESTNYTFKQNYYFVEGDNHEQSIDSRYFGLISEKMFLGKMF